MLSEIYVIINLGDIMPELPEVETVKNGLKKKVLNKKITNCKVLYNGIIAYPNPEDPEDYVMLTDIQGLEDFFGDMDFKVGGTEKGITAIQVDIKVDGLSYKIIEEAFARTRKARQYILDDIMKPQIAAPREELSPYAPQIVSTQIKVEKIKDVIGKGGETINKIIDETGVKIDIEEDGRVFIYSQDSISGKKALKMIEDIAKEIVISNRLLSSALRNASAITAVRDPARIFELI